MNPVNPDASNLPLAELDDLFYLVVVLLLPLLGWVGNLAKKHKQETEKEAEASPSPEEVYDVGPEVEQTAAKERPTWRAWGEPQPSRASPPARAEHPARMPESARPAVVFGPPSAVPEPSAPPPRPPVARQVISEEAVPWFPSPPATRAVTSRPAGRRPKAEPHATLEDSSAQPPASGVGRSAARNVRSGSADSLRQAILLAEILAPPVALRSDEATPGALPTG
ncbi:MAG: hypothetical protein ABII12_06455 [Planctomycetota bacterium]